MLEDAGSPHPCCQGAGNLELDARPTLTEPALVGIDDESDMKESLAGIIAP